MKSRQLSTRVQLSVIHNWKNALYFMCYSWHNIDSDFDFVVKNHVFMSPTKFLRGTRWWTWFRHCATSRKAVGSIADFDTAVFIK